MRRHPTPLLSPQEGRVGDPVAGFFFMLLMALAMTLLAWDLAANSSGWSSLSAVHVVIQTILLMAAIATGSTGAVLWIGHPRPSQA